jgi:hypothetical protein
LDLDIQPRPCQRLELQMLGKVQLVLVLVVAVA